MNTVEFLTGPWFSIRRHHNLLQTLVRHEVSSHYSGAVFSLLWALINPLITLSIYTFVFGYVLSSSFIRGSQPNGQFIFALGLFNGLIIWDFFSSVVSQSPASIISRPNYVKKIVFPLEILTPVLIGAGLFQFLLGFAILMIGIMLFGAHSIWRGFAIPLFLLPVSFYAAGFGWFLSSFGVIFRDTVNAINPLLQIAWFGSAIFFPISSVPSPFQWLFYLNPLAACIEECRRFAVLGLSPNLAIVGIHCVGGWIVACFGLFFFRKTKAGFADVI